MAVQGSWLTEMRYGELWLLGWGSLVVYYGEKPWDGAISLHGMLDIPEEMKVFINDYKILLVEARENNLAFHNVNNVAFFNLMEMVLDKGLSRDEAKEKAIGYAREHNVDQSVIMTVAGATNCKIDYNALSGKGDFNMCTLFEEIAKESEIKGKAEGIIETGLDCGLSENDILEKLQNKLKVSLQMAQEYLKRFGRQSM